MKRHLLVTCSILAILPALAGLNPEREAQQKFYRALNRIEHIGDRKESSEELRQAVSEERLALENLYMLHVLGRSGV